MSSVETPYPTPPHWELNISIALPTSISQIVNRNDILRGEEFDEMRIMAHPYFEHVDIDPRKLHAFKANRKCAASEDPVKLVAARSAAFRDSI